MGTSHKVLLIQNASRLKFGLTQYFFFQQDTMIVPLLHSVLKEEKLWATPWSFNPQHFQDKNGNFKRNPAFLPFSAGKIKHILAFIVLDFTN